MTAIKLFDYINKQINILSKSLPNNVCGFDKEGFCSNKTDWRKPNTGCCTNCPHHDVINGCNTINLVCKTFYCDTIKKKLNDDVRYKLQSLYIMLNGIGLSVQIDVDEQLERINEIKNVYNVSIDEIYNMVKLIVR